MAQPYEIETILSTLTILVDTREHPSKQFNQRVNSFGCSWERHKLDQGDYSYKYTQAGKEIYMDKALIIERKMSLNEIAANFGKERPRFIREFERAKELNTKVTILIEGDSWEDAYNGTYGPTVRHRSKFNPNAMIANLNMWIQRYDCEVRFCKPERTGQMIKDICKYHLKGVLEREG